MTLTGQVGLVHTNRGFLGRLVQVVTRSYWNHTVIAISDTECVSAEPGGAVIRPIAYYADEHVVWSRFDLAGYQRRLITGWARDHIGTPYNFADFVLAGLVSITGRATPEWLRRIVATPDRLICSQLCDYAYQAANLHLFDDRRPEGAVTPASFGRIFTAHGWAHRG
jgi:hypothetical protein